MCLTRQGASPAQKSAVGTVLSTALDPLKVKRDAKTHTETDMAELKRRQRIGTAAHVLTSPVGIPAGEAVQ